MTNWKDGNITSWPEQCPHCGGQMGSLNTNCFDCGYKPVITSIQMIASIYFTSGETVIIRGDMATPALIFKVVETIMNTEDGVTGAEIRDSNDNLIRRYTLDLCIDHVEKRSFLY